MSLLAAPSCFIFHPFAPCHITLPQKEGKGVMTFTVLFQLVKIRTLIHLHQCSVGKLDVYYELVSDLRGDRLLAS